MLFLYIAIFFFVFYSENVYSLYVFSAIYIIETIFFFIICPDCVFCLYIGISLYIVNITLSVMCFLYIITSFSQALPRICVFTYKCFLFLYIGNRHFFFLGSLPESIPILCVFFLYIIKHLSLDSFSYIYDRNTLSFLYFAQVMSIFSYIQNIFLYRDIYYILFSFLSLPQTGSLYRNTIHLSYI